jgi:hypothetical protein
MRFACARHTDSNSSAVLYGYGTRGIRGSAPASSSASTVPLPVEKYTRDTRISPRVSRARKRTALPSKASDWLTTSARPARARSGCGGGRQAKATGRFQRAPRTAPARRRRTVRGSAGETGHDRLVAAVLAPIEGESAIQLGLDPRGHRQNAFRGEVVDEAQRRPLRTHRG